MWDLWSLLYFGCFLMGDGHTEYQPDTLARPVGCHMNGGHIYFKHLYLKKLHLHVRLVGLHGLNCILAQV